MRRFIILFPRYRGYDLFHCLIISGEKRMARNSFVTIMMIVTGTIGMINMKLTRNGGIVGMETGMETETGMGMETDMGMATDIDRQRTEI